MCRSAGALVFPSISKVFFLGISKVTIFWIWFDGKTIFAAGINTYSAIQLYASHRIRQLGASSNILRISISKIYFFVIGIIDRLTPFVVIWIFWDNYTITHSAIQTQSLIFPEFHSQIYFVINYNKWSFLT